METKALALVGMGAGNSNLGFASGPKQAFPCPLPNVRKSPVVDIWPGLGSVRADERAIDQFVAEPGE